MRIKAKDLIAAIENNFESEDEIVLKIGSGRKEYPVADIMKGIVGNSLTFGTEGYVNWKRGKNQVF